MLCFIYVFNFATLHRELILPFIFIEGLQKSHMPSQLKNLQVRLEITFK